MHWAAHVPRPKPGENCQDIRKINKMATRGGVSNAKQLASFRRDTDVKLVPPGPMGPLPKVIPSDVIPSFAYGRKSRPSTPIASVVGAHYASEYEDALASSYARYEAEMQYTGGKHRVRLNRSTTSRIADVRTKRDLANTSEPKELFKLTKFKKVPSRLMLAPMQKSASSPAIGRAADMLE